MVEIDKKLYNDIKDYCKLNDLVIKDFINKLLKSAFTIEKYGATPFSSPPIQQEEQKPYKEACGMVEGGFLNKEAPNGYLSSKTIAENPDTEPIVVEQEIKKSRKRKLS